MPKFNFDDVAGTNYSVEAPNRQIAAKKLEAYLAKQNLEKMVPSAFDSGSPNPEYRERFGDTIAKATENPRQALNYYAGQTIAPDRSVLERAGDAGMTALSAVALPFSAFAGLIGELGGDKTQERKLARDIMMGLEIPINPTSGVTSGVSRLGRQVAVGDVKGARPIGAMTERMKDAKSAADLGIYPNLGMFGRPQAILESTLEANPISGGFISKSKDKIIDQAQKVAQDIAENTGTIKTMEEAGRDLKLGAEAFGNKFRKTQTALYNKVDKFIPPETPVVTTNTNKLFEELSGAASGKTALRDFIGYSSFDDILKDLQSGVDYKTLKTLRTRFGENVKNPAGEITKTIGQQNVDRIYKALTLDMKAAASAKGKDAMTAWQRANDYTSKRMTLIDDALKDIMKAENSQGAYNAVTRTLLAGNAKQSTTKIAQIKKALPKEEFDNFTATMINELGNPTAGVRGTGQEFSIRSFATNLEKIQPDAKRVMFGEKAKDLDDLTKILKRANLAGLETNVSRSGQVALTGSLVLGGAVTGQVVLAGILGTVLTGASYALTSQRFLRAVNKAAQNDMGPLQKLAQGSEIGSPEAQEILRLLAAQQGAKMSVE